MPIPIEIEESRKEAREQERRRCVGMVLAAYANYSMLGQFAIAQAMDKLATDIEKS